MLRRFLQEIFIVIDAEGMQTTVQGNNCLRQNSTIDGTTLNLAGDGTNACIMYFADSNGTSYQVDVDDCVEFKIIEYTGVVRLRLDGTSNLEVLYLSSTYQNTESLKVVNNGTSILVYADGSLVYTKSDISSETRTFKIRLEPNATIKLKDLVSYPL